MEEGRPLYFCPVVSFFYLFSFLALAQRPHIGCLPYFYTWCGLSANAGLKCAASGWLEIQDTKMMQKSPSEHHRTTLSGYIFATKACIDNRKNIVKQPYLLQMTLQYGKLRPTNGWDRLAGLGHPIIFQRVLHLGSVTARQSSSGRQPNFAGLNRGRHLCSAGRPSRWALAHILVILRLVLATVGVY